MADYPQPGNNEFSADEEKAMRQANRVPEKQLIAPITIRIPSELSLRIATMHVMEFVMKEFKRIGFKDALKAIGLK